MSVRDRWLGPLVLPALAVILSAAVADGAGQPAPAKSQEGRERLKEVQRELGREREKAREATRREGVLAKDLQRLDENLKVKSRELRELEARLRTSTQRIGTLSAEIKGTEARLGQTRLLLKRRLRAMYKQGRFGYVRLLLSADDFSSAGRGLKYLAAVAGQDQRLMQSYSRTLAELSQKRAELERYKAEVADATQKAASTRSQIEQEQRERRLLLVNVRQEKTLHLRAIKELNQSARDLQALITRLQSEEERQRRASRTLPRRESRDEAAELPSDGRFASLKGKLPWPASGTLASTFGRQEHPRFHTVTFNRGIEIATDSGRDVLAVADGSVIYADWFKGYGRLVILDHGGGYFTLYAHAGALAVKPGEPVARGQVIAKVGDEAPQLYFELRHRGKPEDPLAWLHPR